MSKGSDTRQAVRQRLYTRGGKRRYYIDLRDIGGGREALVPEGQTYATTDELVALDLAGKRIAELEARKRGIYFGELKRTATLGEFAREWLAFRRSFTTIEGFTGERTIRRYEQALRNLFSVADQDVRIDQFTKSDAKRALSSLANLPSRSGGTLKAASLHQVHVTMKQIFEHAKDEGVVPPNHNPWGALARADRPRLPKTSTTDFLEVYEAAMLLEACERVSGSRLPLKELVATFLLTGGRKAEVLGLEVGDIDLTRKVIHFRANRWRGIKTKERRTVPLWPQLEEILRPYLARHSHRSGLLFPSEDSDATRQVMLAAPNKPLKLAQAIAAELLGEERGRALMVKKLTPRALRPTYCAARLQTLDNGQPIAIWTVRGEMGHSSMKMIEQVYGRLGTIRHRSEVVEYRLDVEDLARARQQELHVGPPNASSSCAVEEMRANVKSEHGSPGSMEKKQGDRDDNVPDLPVSDSQRPGRIRLAEFLKDAGISKNTFFLTYRRDAEWMKRLDGHRDSGDRLHFAAGAGRLLREFRDTEPHFNAGRTPGRECARCTARVHPRLESCPFCGQAVNAQGR